MRCASGGPQPIGFWRRSLRDDFRDEPGRARISEVVDHAAVRLSHARRAGEGGKHFARIARRLQVQPGLEEAAGIAGEHVRHVVAAVGRTVGHRVDPQVDARVEQSTAAGQRVRGKLVEKVLEVARVDAIDLVMELDRVGDADRRCRRRSCTRCEM